MIRRLALAVITIAALAGCSALDYEKKAEDTYDSCLDKGGDCTKEARALERWKERADRIRAVQRANPYAAYQPPAQPIGDMGRLLYQMGTPPPMAPAPVYTTNCTRFYGQVNCTTF